MSRPAASVPKFQPSAAAATSAAAREAIAPAAPWIERLARVGYAGKAILYSIVGVLALQAALGDGGRTTGSRGALATLVRHRYGAIILVVIAADTGAFMAGRGLAGPKLWPSVSPNKTWAGLFGGVLAGGITGALMALAVPGSSALRLGATAAVLAFLAQMGDLMESAIKRRFGAKDTSALIPGHGGIMDRLDGLVIAATTAGLAGFFVDVHSPARALLLGY